MPQVEFIRSRHYGEKTPIPAVQSLPRWYKDADKYTADKNSTYKNCVPFFEAMSSGYVYVTPCDLTFKLKDGIPTVEYDRETFPGFVEPRAPINQFHTPEGYYDHHFAWWSEWGVSLPDGYSALYTQPLNRYDLPFLSTSGIIANDKVFRPGNYPFFIKKGFEGTLPAGIPFAQIIPFPRESWVSTFTDETKKEQTELFSKNSERTKNNLYRENLWVRPDYT